MEIRKIPITKITKEEKIITEDLVAVEEGYEVLVNGKKAFSFTCSPMDIEEMVVGSLYSRGYITSTKDIDVMEVLERRIEVRLHPKAAPLKQEKETVILEEETIFETVRKIFSDQDTLFNRTGCAHSCSLMRHGVLVCTFEDIGRHNALDKVIGYALLNGLPLESCAVFTSGRISGDYMEKLIHAGIPVAVSRAAVTSEAVSLAMENNVILYGFVRGNSANRYS